METQTKEIEDLKLQWQFSQLKAQCEGIFELFEAWQFEKLPLKQKVKFFKDQLAILLKEDREYKIQIAREPDQAWSFEFLIEKNKEIREQLLREMNYYEWDANPNKSGEINIDEARRVSITNYIQFNRAGFAKCLWHEDNNPSMKYHKPRNKVHCFSCGIDNDVVDVVQKLNNWDLPTAVKFLTNKN